MSQWTKTPLLAATPVFLLLLLILILAMVFCFSRSSFFRDAPGSHDTSASRSHDMRGAGDEKKAKKKKAFVWSENPSLIVEAAERGWVAFAFTHLKSSSSSASIRPLSLGAFCGCDAVQQHDKEESGKEEEEGGFEPEMWWEMDDGAAEYMQRLWLNPRVGSRVEVLQACLPLPGPPLGSHSFPQQGYFEITIKKADSGSHPDSVSGSGTHPPPPAADGGHPLRILVVGLAPGGSLPLDFPGSHRGSIGLHSNGRLYLSGANPCSPHEAKLPGPKPLWNVVNTTIGCGFDPASKNVFFTLDGVVVCELNALGSEFGHPLFPTVAANYDVSLVANFGQCSFAYAHANTHRVPDPSFHQRSTKIVSMMEDSGDLFSIGGIDSRWLEAAFPSMGRSQHRHGPSEVESDLFEIVLGNSRRA